MATETWLMLSIVWGAGAATIVWLYLLGNICVFSHRNKLLPKHHNEENTMYSHRVLPINHKWWGVYAYRNNIKIRRIAKYKTIDQALNKAIELNNTKYLK